MVTIVAVIGVVALKLGAYRYTKKKQAEGTGNWFSRPIRLSRPAAVGVLIASLSVIVLIELTK
ncbi:MAG TPA: hypothetical protein VHT75_18300 [Acidimicrobiales bacterium]|nr:hypothetical protein [Acidimicrobiales bacterium]